MLNPTRNKSIYRTPKFGTRRALEEFYEKYDFYLHLGRALEDVIYKQGSGSLYGSSSQEQSIIHDLKGATRSAQED